MNGVRDCDGLRMSHQHYTVATLFPCFTFPLLPGLAVTAWTWWRIWRELRDSEQSVLVLCIGLLFVETLFGMLCWAQCVALLANNAFLGGSSLCAVQGWYTGFYMLAKPLIVAQISIATVCWIKQGTLPSPTACKLVLGSILLFAALYPLLPLVGTSHYTFPTAFCMVDLMDTWFAIPFLIVFACMTGCVGRLLVATKVSTTPWLRRFSKLMLLSPPGWCFAVLIAIVGILTGSSCNHSPFGEYGGAVYGCYVIMAHLNQIVNPLLFGIYWRRGLAKEAATMS